MTMYTLRPATADAIETLYALHRETMCEYVEQTYCPWDEAFQREAYWDRWNDIVAAPERTLDVVLVDGEIAGYLDCELEADGLHLNNIRVAPRWQRQGIGTALVVGVIVRAVADGVPVQLQVLRVNPARTLYERLGFVVVEETATHYRMQRGTLQ